MGRRTMREVVADLRNENAEALLELYEFEYAMFEIRRNLQQLASALHEIEPGVARLANSDPTESARHLVERTSFVAQRAETLARALEEFCRGMDGWGITDAR